MVELLEARLMTKFFADQTPCTNQELRKDFKEEVRHQCFGSTTTKNMLDFCWLLIQVKTKISDGTKQISGRIIIILGNILLRISQVVNHRCKLV